MATLVARYCRKANQLQPMQRLEWKETTKIFLGPRNRKIVLPWQQFLPKVAKKHNRYSSRSPCNKYILKILVKICPWVFAYKELTQEAQRCPKRQVAQAAIRLATAVITFRNKERNARLPS